MNADFRDWTQPTRTTATETDSTYQNFCWPKRWLSKPI